MTGIGWVLRAAHYGFRDAVDAELGALGLTFSQYAALTQVRDHEGQSVAKLAALSELTPQRMHQLIGQLEGKGLIRREPHPDVERVLQTWSTEEGRAVLSRGEDCARAIEERMLTGFTEEQEEQLAKLLNAAIANLHGLADGSRPATDR
ncbi:MarR family winged helix-turn-helix transcriptional regulator [Saccharothrix sp. HUAS TT1]|uniref:MarR family winged helix-turn-helix transcriptional regulator n=1 Tax=unclassified Saccharothrix TaxID=2593673 RepID=UPI00345BB1B0